MNVKRFRRPLVEEISSPPSPSRSVPLSGSPSFVQYQSGRSHFEYIHVNILSRKQQQVTSGIYVFVHGGSTGSLISALPDDLVRAVAAFLPAMPMPNSEHNIQIRIFRGALVWC